MNMAGDDIEGIRFCECISPSICISLGSPGYVCLVACGCCLIVGGWWLVVSGASTTFAV